MQIDSKGQSNQAQRDSPTRLKGTVQPDSKGQSNQTQRDSPTRLKGTVQSDSKGQSNQTFDLQFFSSSYQSTFYNLHGPLSTVQRVKIFTIFVQNFTQGYSIFKRKKLTPWVEIDGLFYSPGAMFWCIIFTPGESFLWCFFTTWGLIPWRVRFSYTNFMCR